MMADGGSILGSSPPSTSGKKVHPFFVAPNSAPQPEDKLVVGPVTPDPSCSPSSERAPERLDHEDGNGTARPIQTEEHRQKRRKTDSTAEEITGSSVDKKPRPAQKSRTSAGNSVTAFIDPGNASTNKDTPQMGSADLCREGHLASRPGPQQLEKVHPGADSASCPSAKDQGVTSNAQPPRKVLKFNPKTGTIGSPPKPKAMPESVPGKAPPKRGRPFKKLIASLSYGEDAESRQRIGLKIEQIMNSKSPEPKADIAPVTTSKNRPVTSDPIVPAQSTDATMGAPSTPIKKATHPFFLGKPKQETSTAEKQTSGTKESPKQHTIFTSTPCSPKHSRNPLQKASFANFGSKPSGPKFPGAHHPAWPWKGMAHIRGEPPTALASSQRPWHVTSRKAKGQQTWITDNESILRHAMTEISIENLRQDLRAVDLDQFQPPSPLLRIPDRHFESGKKLQARVAKELHNTPSKKSKTHPAIIQAFESVKTGLSAFDRSSCESAAWAQKYAPTSANLVLQSGNEASLLRDWLQTLTIRSVDTGAQDLNSKAKSTGPAKKRRKKKNDEFIITSDEDIGFFDEGSDDDGDWGLGGYTGVPKKTVVKSGTKDGARLTNAVLLSGPHGCGKTSTVFAIAKELNFEVFEINAGARRSGKDITEKVGDMTRNHLVQHHQKPEGDAEDPVEDEVARDLKSGKQGMMTNFFQRKPAQKEIAPKNTDQPPQQTPILPSVKDTKKQSTHSQKQSQKQSLILIEEVDVLYEEDKQFWATIISMIAQSKRPFIMTCNDERLVPLQSLNLHGIFRFSSPPKDVAADLMILIAANEGHALNRRAVEGLYETRNHDLRACITELNYWCQIGVGDPQGGFNWFYPRWPKGTDVDLEGDVVRVVSSGTYQYGMGWLARDSTASGSLSQTADENIQSQTWNEWGIDLGSSQETDDFAIWSNEISPTLSTRDGRLEASKVADRFAELMSDADMYSSNHYAVLNQVTVDAGLPELPSKVRDDFTLGRALLEAPPLSRFDSNCMDVSISLKGFARSHVLRTPTQHDASTPIKPMDESGALEKIETTQVEKANMQSISRLDYSLAFDCLAVSDKVMASGYLDPSVFDRNFEILYLDVGPFVRSIVASDQRLQQERLTRSNLLSEGGKSGKKRMRTTRSALSALEGGVRASTRKEKYFTVDINPHLVMRTGGQTWDPLVGIKVQDQVAAPSTPDFEMDGSSE